MSLAQYFSTFSQNNTLSFKSQFIYDSPYTYIQLTVPEERQKKVINSMISSSDDLLTLVYATEMIISKN